MTASSLPSLSNAGYEAILTVNLDAVAANYRFFRDQSKGARVGAVLKANAYGLGALAVTRTLVEEGCDLIFVATAKEALQIRAEIGQPVEIYTLNGYQKNHENDYLSNEFFPILNSLSEVRAWARALQSAKHEHPCGLQIDTGMNRSGLSPKDVETLTDAPDLLKSLSFSLVMSHLACADNPGAPFNAKQLQAFQSAAGLLPSAPLSLANSAGILAGAPYHLDIVRPGIGLYGGNPLLAGGPDLATVASLHAPIIQTRLLKSGQSVGYGASFKVDRPSRIATIAVGYADGYMRHMSNVGSGFIGNIRTPIAGRISMDLTCFDVTDVAETEAQLGTYVELLGEHLSIDEVGKTAGSFGYEILTNLGPRYVRRYIRNGRVVKGQ